MKKKRLARRLAYGFGALLVVVAALLVAGDWLIDTPAVKGAIQQRLSTALGGQIAWEGLDLQILPAPHGVLRRVRLEMPGVFSARAEQLDAYLRLWPLLRGHPEIASLSVARPEIRIEAGGGAAEPGPKPLEPLAAYRQFMSPTVDVLRRFAPDTQFRIDGAAIDLATAGLALRDLNVAARTGHEHLDLEVAAASNLWSRMEVKGRVQYADLSASVALSADGLAILPEVPRARVRGELRTDAHSAIEGEADVAAAELFDSAKVKSRLPAAGGLQVNAQLEGVRVAPALAIARRWAPAIDVIESSEGRLAGSVDVSLGEAWRVDARVARSDAAVKLAQLPWKISVSRGRVVVSAKGLEASGVHGAVGDSAVTEATARLELGAPLRLSAASGRATLKLEQWFPWLRDKLPQLEEVSSVSGAADVTLQRLALHFDRPAAVDFAAVVAPRQVSASLKALPAPVSADGGAVTVDASQARLDRVAVAMLDAKALVSGTVSTKDARGELAAADGVLGEKIVQWALARAEMPARFEPKTPLRVAAQRLAWAPGPVLDADARIDFSGGPQLGVAVGWRSGETGVRRLSVKDARSDAVLTAQLGGEVVQASFSGALDSRTLAAMLRQPLEESGNVRGKLRVTVDRAKPQNSLADGDLRIEALDLGWLVGRKARVESIQVKAQGSGALIPDARLEWEEQKFSLRGEIWRTAQGPMISAQLDSPGVVVARLLPAQKEKPAAERSKLWPLPVTGQVEVRAGFVQFARHRIEPLEGSLVFERERAFLDIKQARTCGLSFPLTFEAKPEHFAFAALVTMRDEPLETAMRCLTGGTVEITGNAQLRAELRSRGGSEAELVRNLAGTAQGEVRNGRVKRFALIGNILSLRNIVSLNTMQEQGFPYRSLSAKGRFEGGEFLLEEGFFDSDAARIAANGRIDLQGANTRLDVLLGLLTTVDRVAGAVPILGDIFGGSMLALPVGVSGDIRNPLVVPLGPRAVTDRLLGIFERTLKLPGKLVAPAAGSPGAEPAARPPN